MSIERFCPDDLRRLASGMLMRLGVVPDRATRLAGYLLWFDLAGWSEAGLRTLPDWMSRIQQGSLDANAPVKVGMEREATILVDGKHGPGPCVLYEAARVAVEKAREAGVGLARVTNVGHTGPATPIVVEIAIGPMVGCALGPAGAWSSALPSASGLPAVSDSCLMQATSPPELARAAPSPWSFLLGPDEWFVQAVSVTAIESLASVQDRVEAGLGQSVGRVPGFLDPATWRGHRDVAYESGLGVSGELVRELRAWAERLEVSFPEGHPRSSRK